MNFFVQLFRCLCHFFKIKFFVFWHSSEGTEVIGCVAGVIPEVIIFIFSGTSRTGLGWKGDSTLPSSHGIASRPRWCGRRDRVHGGSGGADGGTGSLGGSGDGAFNRPSTDAASVRLLVPNFVRIPSIPTDRILRTVGQDDGRGSRPFQCRLQRLRDLWKRRRSQTQQAFPGKTNGRFGRWSSSSCCYRRRRWLLRLWLLQMSGGGLLTYATGSR